MRRHLFAIIAILVLSVFVMAQTGGPAPHAAGRQFADSLAKPQATRALFSLDSEERFNWHYVPKSRKGVALADVNAAQRKRFDDLLRAGLSEAGFRKAWDVVELEPILGEIEGSSGRRDPGLYFVTLFGDPGPRPWGWRFEGHHLSLNFTAAGSEIGVTPMFIGANPARVPSGPRAGWRVLRDEEEFARELLQSLSPAQRTQAIIRDHAPSDIITGADREVLLPAFEGLPARRMNAVQRALLLRLIRAYVGNATASVEAREMAALVDGGLERVHFAWAGGREAGKPHYYRIHGPSILIEYDNTQDGANHIHSVWRSPGRDFGQDLLRRHYVEAAHHRGK